MARNYNFVYSNGVAMSWYSTSLLGPRLISDQSLSHLWFKPSRGPLWELNRRTGLVTLFDYDNYSEYKKNGTIGEITAPFHEFDAYLATSPPRHLAGPSGPADELPIPGPSLPRHHHQFRLPDGAGPNPATTNGPVGLFQNYMDASRPLPDLPCFEKCRYLDPVSAEHDRQNGGTDPACRKVANGYSKRTINKTGNWPPRPGNVSLPAGQLSLPIRRQRRFQAVFGTLKERAHDQNGF
ncbi:hypothetical protein [Stutzerimonas zhaodongensis]|nr:hypothetical protein [Stutzerimonas zhaodongensis]MCQ4315535.1 hypothetical protein [Stutzerimonas zhaodongensis]